MQILHIVVQIRKMYIPNVVIVIENISFAYDEDWIHVISTPFTKNKNKTKTYKLQNNRTKHFIKDYFY